MTAETTWDRHVTRSPAVAVTLYVLLLAACAVAVWLSIANILTQRAMLADARDILSRLEQHQQTAPSGTALAGNIPTGSPFVSGDTVTVAGAALVQRVAGAITRYGGSVQSSQVDLQGPQAKDGFITLTISCELEQPGLQNLLYDLEAGMPLLFVDQLAVQGPQPSGGTGGKIRVLLAVSGQWKAGK